MAQQALGMIETKGLVPAVAGADAAAKAANVRIIRRPKSAGSGLVTVLFEGDVAAVTAAVETGAAEARRVGTVVSVHVIPRPVDDLEAVSGAAAPPARPARRRKTNDRATNDDNGG